MARTWQRVIQVFGRLRLGRDEDNSETMSLTSSKRISKKRKVDEALVSDVSAKQDDDLGESSKSTSNIG